jgi:hypothetical protein
VTAGARATGVALDRIFRDATFDQGDLAFHLSGDAIRLHGSGRLAGAPVSVDWHEPLAARGPARQVDLTGRLDAAARSALGLDTSPVLDGTVAVGGKWSQSAPGDGRVDLELGLDDASIDAFPIALRKPAGAPGKATTRLRVRSGAIASVDDIAIETPSARVSGAATLAPGGKTIRTLELVTTLAAPDRSSPVRLTLEAKPDRDESSIAIRCDDASVWLEAMDTASDWTGGRLDLTGSANLSPDAFRFDGRLDVRNVALNRSPVLAEIVSLTSLSGIESALRGKGGVRFEQVGADLAWADDVLRIRDGAATGPALRLLLEGSIDRRNARANLEGTLVPSYYGLNEAPQHIPVIGSLLGGSANAVLTIDFSVTGPLADPKVSVKPLSSVAPGILRDVMKRLER